MELKQYLGIILLIIIFGPIIYVIIQNTKIKKSLLNYAKQNKESEEIIRVTLSRTGSPSSLKENPKERNTVIILLTILLLIIVFIYIITKYQITSKLILIIGIILIIIIYIFNLIYTSNHCKKLLPVYLRKYYNNIENIPSSHKEIISGNINEVGNIRQVDSYKCFIESYKCTLTNFYEEKLIRTDTNTDHISYYYKYIKIHNYISYDYNLNHLNITNINLQNDKFINMVNEIKRKKIIKDFIFNNNHFIIIKETVLNGYSEIDAKRDSADVKLFYEIIISLLQEE